MNFYPREWRYAVGTVELLLKIFAMIFKAPGDGMGLLAVYVGLDGATFMTKIHFFKQKGPSINKNNGPFFLS